MWLIRAALRRPVTVLVLVAALGLSSILAIMRTRVDIFPNLDLPVIYVAQPHGGMSPHRWKDSFLLLRVPLPLYQRH
jgi:multidrug efflux pump subunit AcrB